MLRLFNKPDDPVQYQMMTVSEAAVALGKDRRTIKAMVQDGRLIGGKTEVNGHLMVTHSSVQIRKNLRGGD